MSLYGLFYRLFIIVTGLIPYRALYQIGKLMGWIFYLTPNKHKRISLENLNLVFPELTSKELNKLLRESLFHSSMNILECGMVWGSKKYIKDRQFIEVRNFDLIKNSISQNNGVLLFTPHLGNIEILINYLGSEFETTIPYTKPKNSSLDKVITKSRNDAGVKMVPADARGIRKILSGLKEKKLVAIASDQVPKKGNGGFSKFFHKEIYSMTLLPKLQEKTDCKVHLMYCERKKNASGFVIHFKESIDLKQGTREGVDRMNIEFEKCIMELPGQYAWEYKKFKRTSLQSIYKR
jgi:KDO2-lipid IV(A) lauroyltransferase